MAENGVVVSTKEMYEILQEIKSQVNVIQAELRNFGQTDERSRQALELANDAMQKAHELEKQVDKVDSRQQWLIGLFITAIVGIGGLITTFIK